MCVAKDAGRRNGPERRSDADAYGSLITGPVSRAPGIFGRVPRSSAAFVLPARTPDPRSSGRTSRIAEF